MKNILFIGGGGFIGSNLIKQLVSSSLNYQVFVLEPHNANLNKITNLNISIIHGNIKDIELIENIIKEKRISIVVHLVSTLLPKSNYDDYKQEFEEVIFPTLKVLKLCAKYSIKIIYFSSGGTIYGNKQDLSPFKEEDMLQPISYYGLSKLIIEESILFEHRVNNVEYLILRPSNPYGPGQNLLGKQGLIAVSVGKLLSNEPIKIYGNGSQVRDYIYIDDLAKIFEELLKKNISNTIINIGSGIGYSINEILQILKNIVIEDFSINYVSSRSSDVSNMILDNSRLKKLISFNITPIEKGILSFYHYAKKIYE